MSKSKRRIHSAGWPLARSRVAVIEFIDSHR
jgi:hypothetical protein